MKRKPEEVIVADIGDIVGAELENLRDARTAAIADLEAKITALEAESEQILKSSNELKLVLPAAKRQAERLADELLLAGKPEEAAEKIAEQRRAERAPAEMQARLTAIQWEIAGLYEQERNAAVATFWNWYPQLHEVLVDEQTALCDALDAAWAGINAFAVDSGHAIFPSLILKAGLEADLTARNRGPEKPLFQRLQSWFNWGAGR